MKKSTASRSGLVHLSTCDTNRPLSHRPSRPMGRVHGTRLLQLWRSSGPNIFGLVQLLQLAAILSRSAVGSLTLSLSHASSHFSLTQSLSTFILINEYEWNCSPRRMLTIPWLAAWRSGQRSSSMNEVNARRARLLLGWVTVFRRVYHLGM